MAKREIVQIGDDVLRKKSREVTVFDEKLATLIDDMRETLEKENGVGLAGPQVGVLKRVVVLFDEDRFIELVNPEIIKTSGEQQNIEGCLSIPGKYGITSRPKKVTVKGFDRYGNEVKYTGKDILARGFCHEIDHLNGVLFIDNVVEMIDPAELTGKKKKK